MRSSSVETRLSCRRSGSRLGAMSPLSAHGASNMTGSFLRGLRRSFVKIELGRRSRQAREAGALEFQAGLRLELFWAVVFFAAAFLAARGVAGATWSWTCASPRCSFSKSWWG